MQVTIKKHEYDINIREDGTIYLPGIKKENDMANILHTMDMALLLIKNARKKITNYTE